MSELHEIKTMLKDHIDKTDEAMAGILKEQKTQREELQRMNFVLLGDEKSKIDGLAQKTLKNSAYISRDKKQKWVAFGLLMGGHISLWEYIRQKFGA